MPFHPSDFFDHSALDDRLVEGVKQSNKRVVFVLGSGLSMPPHKGAPGVPSATEIISMVRQRFSGTTRLLFDRELAEDPNQYQAAFRFLAGRRGQDAANSIVKAAVRQARRAVGESGMPHYKLSEDTTDEACKGFDLDYSGWFLSPGHEAVGRLIAAYPDRFGSVVLTTNFDPLIGASIGRAGGHSFRTALHHDGSPSQTSGDGCHIIHLHGYWYGTDTLHTVRQLTQPRPMLKASLTQLLRDRTVVVCGYGGWDDIFTAALVESSLEDQSAPEIAWTFYDPNPAIRPELEAQLARGVNRGRVALYSGIDANVFFPRILAHWQKIDRGLDLAERDFVPSIDAQSAVASLDIDHSAALAAKEIEFARSEQDNPPHISFFVGRDAELHQLIEQPFTIGFISGFGGEGKSALAARYYINEITRSTFDYRVWRDCKEESERFEHQIVSIVRTLGRDRVSPGELARQNMADLARLLQDLSQGLRILFVFDNADSYIDLEKNILAGAPAEFIRAVQAEQTGHQFLFTCRPAVRPADPSVLHMRLGGLGMDASKALFRLRGANVEEAETERAHRLTNGHAFALNLIAAQVSQSGQSEDMQKVLNSLEAGGREIPTATLRSIWGGLREREQMVLQALAETVRPITETELADFLSRRIPYNRFSKALRVLRNLSLIESKPHRDNLEVLELHPLVRIFIRKTFPRTERIWFIDALLSMYTAFFRTSEPFNEEKPSFSTIARWVEATELYLEAGDQKEAFKRLLEVSSAYLKGGSPHEFVRVAKILFDTVDWSQHGNYPGFDDLFSDYFDMLSYLGRNDECLLLLEKYRETTPSKDARYINFCNLNAHFHWLNGNYLTAIKWGSEGVALKEDSQVDTEFDTSHNLALAQRESGDIDPALTYFLGGVDLSVVLDPKEYEVGRGGPFYGNIGRCLHLMGQVEPALICYKKSALALETRIEGGRINNQGYARQWIGELLLESGKRSLGLHFLTAAFGKWNQVAPPKAISVQSQLASELGEQPDLRHEAIAVAERHVQRWLTR